MAFICIVGMHRSGTSCLTGITQQFNVELGEVFTENLHNKKGNRENGRILYLNEHVLGTNGGAWDKPVLVSKWSKEEAGERDAIIRELQQRADEHWGFKDTRALFTLPFWLEVLETPNFIGTFRHPQRVAMSLNNRDGTPFEASWELWHTYNTRLLEVAAEYNFPITNFDLPDNEYLDDVLSKLVQIGLDEKHTDSARKFFDSGLRNQTSIEVDTVDLPQHVNELYEQLLEYKQQHDAAAG